MPLATAHQEFINNTIEYLFDLKPNVQHLQYYAQKYLGLFFEACKQPTIVRAQYREEDDESYALYLCLVTPETRFLQLEGMDNNTQFNVADVQLYIFEYISTLFKKIIDENQLKITLEKLPWINKATLHKWLGEKLLSKDYFKSKSNFDQLGVCENSWLIPESAGSIYSSKIIFTAEKDPETEVQYSPKHIYLRIIVTLDANTTSERVEYLKEIPEDFETDEEHDEFQHTVKEEAAAKARIAALGIVFDYLEHFGEIKQPWDDLESGSVSLRRSVSSSSLTVDDLENLESIPVPTRADMEEDAIPAGFNLLLHSFYFNALKSKIISLDEIEHLNQIQIDNLLSATLINLTILHDLSLSEALLLETHHIRILEVPLYSEIAFKDLLVINAPQSKMLLLPAIVNLQKLKILSFDEALQLTHDTVSVLCHPFYYDYASKNPRNLRHVFCSSSKQKDNLLQENIIFLIGRGKLTVELAKNLTAAFIELANNTFFYNSLSKGKIKWNTLHACCSLLHQEPAYMLLIKRNFSNLNPEKLHTLSTQLNQIFLLIISNTEESEKASRLKDTLQTLSQHPDFIHQDIIIILIQKMLLNIKTYTQDINVRKSKTSIYFEAITKKIEETYKLTQQESDPSIITRKWLIMLSELIETARRFDLIKSGYKNALSFFSQFHSKLNSEDKAIQAICLKLADEANILRQWYNQKPDDVCVDIAVKDFPPAYRS